MRLFFRYLLWLWFLKNKFLKSMVRSGLLDLNTYLVKIMVEIYVHQKTCIKCLVVVWLRLLFKVFFT